MSVEALTRRLEDFRLIPIGTWDRLEQEGFRVREAQSLLALPGRRDSDELLPTRFRYLAAEAFERSDLSEGQFAHFLRVDRLEARKIAGELANRPDVADNGEITSLALNLGELLPTRRGERRDGE